MRHIWWKATLATAVAGMLLPQASSVSAQLMPVPDNTLGEASSTLIPIDAVYPTDVIEGGLRRENALLHSFEAFHVGADRAIYFNDPGVDSILSRVTGAAESQILGVLGVLGDADLFIINPNGIIFGENSQLDLRGGSFLATTADAFELDISDTGLPTAPMLTVQPSAFLFNRANPAAIVNNSRTLPPAGLDSAPSGGLRVADGERITLLGGDVSMDKGGLSALGGRIELGGLSEPGTVIFNADGSLEFPAGVARSDVSIADGSRLSASDSTVSGGHVTVTANTLEITGNSGVSAGTVGESSFVEGQAGDITLDASRIRVVSSDVDNVVRGSSGNGGDVLITADELFVSDRSVVQSTLLGEGSTGQVTINARDRITVNNSLIFSNLGGTDRTTVATGDGGSIEITTPVLLLTNGSQLQSGTFSQGNAGDVIINASESVAIESSSISSEVFTNRFGTAATGDGGNIEITTPVLSLTNGSRLSSRTTGQGNSGAVRIAADSLSFTGESRLSTSSLGQGSAGNVEIETRDRTLLNQSYIFNNLEQAAELADDPDNVRNAGDIQIVTGLLDLVNGAQIQSNTSGRGNAGNVTVQAQGRISIEGVDSDNSSNSSLATGISSRTTGQGNGGTVRIAADSLSLVSRSQLSTVSLGQGSAGNVEIETRNRTLFDQSYIFSNLEQASDPADDTDNTRSAGDIQIVTGSLDLVNGAQFQSNTSGHGNAGSVTVQARDHISIEGVDPDNSSPATGISSRTTGQGNGGTVRITAGSLSLTGRSRLSTSSSGQGSAGNVEIETRDHTFFDQSFIFNDLEQASELADDSDNARSAGDIQIVTGSLELINGAQLQSSTGGRGDAGNVTVQARDHISIEGVNPNNSSFASVITARTREGAQGEGGDISLTAGSVRLADGGRVRTATRGDGNAGNIRIETGSLSLTGGSKLSTDSSGQGSAGNVEIETGDHTLLDQSSILSNLRLAPEDAVPADDTGNVPNAGDIQIETGSLDLINGGQIESSTGGRGNAGNVTIQARDRISIEGVNPDFPLRVSSILASTGKGAIGEGGDVSLAADRVRLADNGLVSTATSNSFQGGNVTVNANTLELVGGGQVLTTTDSSGRAGDINLAIAGQTTLAGTNTFRANNDSTLFSGFFANTTGSSAGGGGTVALSTSELQVLNQARIEVDSQGSGTAGDMAITADTIRLDEGRLTAETAAVNGGNIALSDVGLLLLRNGSLISTTAGTAGAGGNGGNIDIEADVIVSVPGENNDIRANAFSGSGGSVNIDTSGLFGIAAQSQDSPLTNDITASSARGIQGTVDIATPETDPRGGLTELPIAFADASDQITQTCSGNGDGQSSEFVVSGRGGLPPSPIDVLADDAPLESWAVLDESTETDTSEATLSALPDPTLSTEGGIVEAQGWTRENGIVKLVSTTPTSVAQTAMAC